MPIRQSSGIVSLIQTQFIIICNHRSMHSPPNFKCAAVILHIPAALSFFNNFTAFRTTSSETASSDIYKSMGAFAAAVDVSRFCGTGSHRSYIKTMSMARTVGVNANQIDHQTHAFKI